MLVVETKKEDFKKLYNDIDRAQRWRPYVKWFQGLFDGVKGLISLVIYLAVLAGIGIGLWIYWPTLLAMVQGKPVPAATAPGPTTPATTTPGTGTPGL